MPKIGIVTDSTADIPPQLAESLGIAVVPCEVHFGEQVYLDLVDLTRSEFYAKLAQAPPFPKTSQPPPGEFLKVYHRVAEEADQIISIHLSSKLSTLFNVARLAREMVPELDITLVDSDQVSMCTGWLAIAAARAARAGQSRDEIMALLHDMIPRLRLVAVIQDLHYLRRSGRVSWISNLLGTMLQVKPFILIQDGRVEMIEKIRTRGRSIQRLVEYLLAARPLEEISLLHVDAPEAAAEVAELLRPELSGYPLIVAEAGLVVSSHGGPGTIGAAFVLGKNEER